jgi:hypothetical protein
MESADKPSLPEGEASRELRMDMMRSIVTEPLLGQVREAISDPVSSQEFQVIIALNELFHDGTAAAMDWVGIRLRYCIVLGRRQCQGHRRRK